MNRLSVTWLLLALAVGVGGFSRSRTNIQLRLTGISRASSIFAAQESIDNDSDAAAAQANEFANTDADSADSGPKILMPPEEMLNVMPSDADNFAGYLLPYAGLVLFAFALASAAFATLVLSG